MLTTLSRSLLYAAFFFLPLTFIKLFSNFTLSDLLLVLAFITLAISKSGRKFISDTVILKNEFLIPLFIFSIGFFLSLENSHVPMDSITAFMQIIFIFVIAYPVLVEVVKNEEQVRKIALMLIIPGIVISVLMIMIKIIGMNLGIDLLAREGWRGRTSYGGMEPNIPGRIILQNVPLVAVFAITALKNSTRLLAILLIVVQLTAILLTSSRSNFVTFILGAMLFWYLSVKFGRKIKFTHAAYATMLVVIVLAIFYSINPEFFISPFERYKTILNAQKSASSMERLRVIDMGFIYLNKNPLIGMGLGSSFLYTKVNLHNPILLTWLENGILGTIGFTSLYIVLMVQGLRAYRDRFIGSYMLLALTIVMVMMIFGDMFMANSYKRVLWVPALLFMAYSKNLSAENSKRVEYAEEH